MVNLSINTHGPNPQILTKGTPGKGIVFKKHDHLNVKMYIDADWAGSTTRSTVGGCSFVEGNLVT